MALVMISAVGMNGETAAIHFESARQVKLDELQHHECRNTTGIALVKQMY